MDIKTEKNGEELTVIPSGELNTVTSPELGELLHNEIDGVKTLVIDFAECKYVSSSGLRVILSAHKYLASKGGELKLRHINADFSDVLVNTGLYTVFNIEQ